LELIQGEVFNNTLFRDILFVIIPAAALGLSAVLDYLCINYKDLNGTSFALSMLSIIFNTLALGSGLVAFIVIPKDNVPVASAKLLTFSVIICYALLMSIITEFFVSTDNHRCYVALRRGLTGA
jgi:uncharacterized membrane protein YozB (DUF420 family)